MTATEPPKCVAACVVAVGSTSLLVPLLAGVPAWGTSAGRSATTAATAAVMARPVTPRVREVAVPEVDRRGRPRLAAQSAPVPVHGYGVVGATWRGAAPAGLRLAIRTRGSDGWSRWRLLHGGSCPCAACVAARASAVAYGGHGPDPESPEARGSRAGTDPTAVGEVGAVQVRAISARGRAPDDLELSVINPGTSPTDTATDSATDVTDATEAQATADRSGSARPVAGVATSDLQAVAPAVQQVGEDTSGVRAPRPRIRSRKAWGADRSLRSGQPRYGRVKGAFVHHTVNANDYTRSDVPAIIRGIYAYHTQSLGWSDIGYNFLVDKFGRIWMGRYGGRRRAVIGAHTYGYNHLSTGAAALGNFEQRRPPLRMKRAFGRLLGWKLGLHGVRAGDGEVWMEGSRLRAINGHRDAGQTACPGIYLYRNLDDIRRIAIRRQRR